jgi:signal peptidase I
MLMTQLARPDRRAIPHPGTIGTPTLPGDEGALIRSVLSWLLVWAAMAAALLALWPAALGGSVRFAVVHGSSMEPTFHPGDVLYARSTSQFQIGDAALYRIPPGQPGAGGLVVHRIQGRTARGQFIMQGDNRPDDDGVLPGVGDLLARPLVNLGPLPGRLLLLLPWAMLAVVACALGWYLWPERPEQPASGRELRGPGGWRRRPVDEGRSRGSVQSRALVCSRLVGTGSTDRFCPGR